MYIWQMKFTRFVVTKFMHMNTVTHCDSATVGLKIYMMLVLDTIKTLHGSEC